MTDYRQYADDEKYLFGIVSSRFKEQGWLGAFDVMTIARWKAERARAYVARRLLSKGGRNLDEGARSLTTALAAALTAEAQFRIVFGDWGFRLPMGSAILTVCFPFEFGVYDVRVCGQLKDFQGLVNLTNTARVWEGYQRFLAAVKHTAPSGLSLRECDRWLMGETSLP